MNFSITIYKQFSKSIYNSKFTKFFNAKIISKNKLGLYIYKIKNY